MRGRGRPVRLGRRRRSADSVSGSGHLRGVAQRRERASKLGVRHPGTYAGFVETIPRIAALGVNAVEFLPIHETGHEHHLHEKGLTNYWGYGTIGFFAPDSRFASAPHKASQIAEFKTVVRELHRAGIEVILDVVYNHTAEGDHMGPTFCFKGIDNASYYKRHPDDPRRYWDATGCGNTLDAGHPQVIRVVLDSLRMWAEEYRVDGFRFDLAPVLGRERHAFNAHAPLLETIMNDPVLRERKLIAEPWDLGPDGYRQGGFAEPFAEWNGRFRDTARRFIRGDDGQIAPLAEIVAGSSPVFQPSGRGPHRSIHFITSHDGFTLHDLVTYERKRNRANRERNNDGDNNNHSSNWGQEGPRADADILKTRRRVMKTFMTLLFASQGVPMIGAGDEIGRTQRGNNNAYCQDNAISWLDYERGRSFEDLRRFVTRLIAWRKSHAVLRRTTFLTGADGDGNGRDVTWYGADGREPDWRNPATRFLAYVLDGRYASETTEPEADLLIAFNAGNDAVRFPLPPAPQGGSWKRVADTAREAPEDFTVLPEPLPSETDLYVIAEHAAVILTAERP
ncbi:MAG: glycogen debranching protein GlgX [Deltaproteobacteria bacterium]|nr:glycogen debranching protein GlgX [Deltaproteobacteria bacterium]